MSERLPVSSASEKTAMRFSWSAVAILSFPMAFLYVGYAMGFEDFRLMTYRNPAVVIFTLLYLFLVSHGANRLDRPASRESRLWAGCLLTTALSLCFYQPTSFFALLQILALHLEAVYWTLCRTRILIHNRTSGSFPFELAWGFCVLPLRHFLLRIKVLSSALRDYLTDRSCGVHSPAMIGFSLLLAGGIGMTAWSLLSGADPFFAEVADQVGAGLFGWLSPQTLLTVILSLPVGAWLFGLAGGSLYQAEPAVPLWRWQTALDRMQVLPGFTTALVIGVLCGIYGLFFAVEAYAYLTQLIAGAITVTLACQYAVQGFWQLCGIVLLNLSVLAVLHTLSETSLLAPGLLRSLAKLLSVCTIAFVLLAGLKLGVYALVYGWTLRRVLAVWALSVLAVGAGLAWVRLKQIIPAARWGILYALISFTLLSCFPLESWTGFLH